MANYTLQTAFRSDDQQDMTMIKLGNPIIADRKQVLTAYPSAKNNQLTFQNSALKERERDTRNSRRTDKAILTIAAGQESYAGL